MKWTSITFGEALEHFVGRAVVQDAEKYIPGRPFYSDVIPFSDGTALAVYSSCYEDTDEDGCVCECDPESPDWWVYK